MRSNARWKVPGIPCPLARGHGRARIQSAVGTEAPITTPSAPSWRVDDDVQLDHVALCVRVHEPPRAANMTRSGWIRLLARRDHPRTRCRPAVEERITQLQPLRSPAPAIDRCTRRSPHSLDEEGASPAVTATARSPATTLFVGGTTRSAMLSSASRHATGHFFQGVSSAEESPQPSCSVDSAQRPSFCVVVLDDHASPPLRLQSPESSRARLRLISAACRSLRELLSKLGLRRRDICGGRLSDAYQGSERACAPAIERRRIEAGAKTSTEVGGCRGGRPFAIRVGHVARPNA